MSHFRYFKSNIITGCGIPDISKKIGPADGDDSEDEFLYIESSMASNSRGIQAALNHKWILEITEKEAAQYIPIPIYQPQPIYIQRPEEPEIKHSSNNKVNEAAYQRQQDRLKRIEASTPKAVSEIPQPTIENIEPEPGKHTAVNLAAANRIKQRQSKLQIANKTSKEYLNDYAVNEKEKNEQANAIRKNMVQNQEKRLMGLLKDKNVEAKNLVQQQIEEKLAEKIAKKKLTIKTTIPKPVEEPIKEAEVSNNLPVKAKRGRPKKLVSVELKKEVIASA